MPSTDRAVELIDEQAQLDRICAAPNDLARIEAIACDTEFVRTNTFRPQLCLIQLALDGRILCLDVIAAADTSRLGNWIATVSPAWILHAAKQDLEAMHSTFARLPSRIMDTQIAAGLLGHAPQIGYASLVEALLEIRLPKGETRTDWSRRPLTDAQLSYAAADVAHLHELHARLGAELERAGRSSWAEEDSAALLDPSLYEYPPAEAWQRLGNIRYLPVPIQARARALAAWRESEAQRLNRPRRWILADRALLQIAHKNPASSEQLRRIEELPAAVIRKRGEVLIEVCRRADADVAAGRIAFEQQSKPNPPDERALKKLVTTLRGVAGELGVAAELLATRRELAAMLRGHRDLRVLSGWRREIVGGRLLAAL